MNRLEEVKQICNRDMPEQDKLRMLQDILLDLKNEMEAQDQNMHPEVRNKLAEAYRLANQSVIELLDNQKRS